MPRLAFLVATILGLPFAALGLGPRGRCFGAGWTGQDGICPNPPGEYLASINGGDWLTERVPGRAGTYTLKSLKASPGHYCVTLRPWLSVGGSDYTVSGYFFVETCCDVLCQDLLFRRGECDGDGQLEGQVTDAVFLLNYNFRGGSKPPCLAACDANGDGQVEGQVTDAIYLLTYNFLGGPQPVGPFPNCGAGPLDTDEALGCETTPDKCR